ncbi:MAG: hypothetical protein Kow0075_07150 [Salibacteraceae bacterium]
MRLETIFSLLLLAVINSSLRGQTNESAPLEIHGNFDVYAQFYIEDTVIGAPTVREKMGINAFTNLIATKGNFTAGMRIESYMPQVLGFDARFGNQAVGIPFRYINFLKEGLDVTAGSFYEQFGSGMILRSYEERGLGLDNAFDGLRIRYSPAKGLYLKGLIGKQRYYWQKSEGTVRGLDAEVSLNEMISALNDSPMRAAIGGSFVSKYQPGGGSALLLPENVAAWATRAQINYKNIQLQAEYAYKYNDPSADNNYIYRPGQALLLSATYSRKGFAVNLTGKTLDNMAFRSDRKAIINDLYINYLPALTRQHTYNLAATLFPYATQPNGEIGFQTDIIYKIKKGTWLGGKYGTTIQINAALINGHKRNYLMNGADTMSENEVQSILDRQEYVPGDEHRIGYTTSLFSIGDEIYYRDYNVEIDRKINKDLKIKTTYAYFVYNIDRIQVKTTGRLVHAHVGVIDALYKFTSKHGLRTELQHLWTEQDHGNWAFIQFEYSYSPHWFVTVLDQYNYGNKNPADRLHYPTIQIAYIQRATRISIGYGRQRAGIFCVGGVCRNVPAANGFTLAITSSF